MNLLEEIKIAKEKVDRRPENPNDKTKGKRGSDIRAEMSDKARVAWDKTKLAEGLLISSLEWIETYAKTEDVYLTNILVS